MKKTFLLAALFIGMMLFASGYADSHHQRTCVGMSAPALALPTADSILTLDRLQGEFVLITFWSATDAPSREAANLYTAWSRQHPDAHLKVVGVNFDDSRGLFNEIVRLDSLVAANQYYAEGDTARVIADNYGLSGGFGSVLINPEGKIVAFNPPAAELGRYL